MNLIPLVSTLDKLINFLSTKIPLGNAVEAIVDFIISNFSVPLNTFSEIISSLIGGFEAVLSYGHPFLLIAVFAIAAWKLKGKNMAVFVALGLMLVLNLRMWDPLVTTMASIITSVVVCLILGIPIGILKARSRIIDLITRPMLDFMQTIPPFVYLIPALMFFGLGNVSGVIATVVFAIAPPIRLTYLGIKQVSDELKEAGRAFGCTPWQMLYKIELPLALPSIMMGVNQCIMLSLSMVVIAAMIGAGGLGKPVLRSLSTVDIGLGFEAGLGVVILAMILDRIFGREQ
ncbi:ABC transporter permease [Acetohalobium arabaticum]|uniref:Binding-protein-dependent transport systems inner membrane component n=1 Tax=Acetohalobium arabaticum (strain ATCC 49924 / DSM 5501 / Z-7288) TaxID=574087 RepID=D9QUS5_ACEAZ|nr:proline/glycine betaine ABC transporter permease [Acetohalobium arabaticum]ADL11984.1 binding-protein-dependent transport systems inner membrane component [Acetohalobium arabaticum DSM 5501]